MSRQRARFLTSAAPALRRVTRRELLQLGVAAACALSGTPALGADTVESANTQRTSSGLGSIGRLKGPDANGLLLPDGFVSRVLARSRVAPLAGKSFLWHDAPDGGATFPTPDGGWIYTSNSEVLNGRGGASALKFSAAGTLIDAYPILSGTHLNCAGGATPWGTWLSCEEFPAGRVWECDPSGRHAAVVRPALGVFTHEAVAVDPARRQLYLTEDLPDGRWYRFTPARTGADGRPDLDFGVLEAASVAAGGEGPVRWHRIADASAGKSPTRYQASASSAFHGGEGCWYAAGCVYFTTKGDDRVWAYDIARQRLDIVYDAQKFARPVLSGVDNVTVSAAQDVLVAEDGGDLQIIALTPDRKILPIVQIIGHPFSEVAGPAFDPSGGRLYFSSQRGAAGRNQDGVTYEVSGPFPTARS